MNIVKAARSLGPVDAKGIRRDSMNLLMLALPLILAMILRFGLPPLTAAIRTQTGFDLTPYYPVVMGYFVIALTPMVMAVLIGFLLLDEKDDQTLTVLQVTPMSLSTYIAYRLLVPTLLSVIVVFFMFPLAGIGTWDVRLMALSALASAPLAPMFTMYLAGFAANKVQGFALMKLSGAVLLLPVFAYFVDGPVEYLLGLVPTYWPIKTYWMLAAGETGAWIPLAIGIVYQVGITALLVRRFNRQLHK